MVYEFLMDLIGTREVKNRFLAYLLVSALSSVIPALRLWCVQLQCDVQLTNSWRRYFNETLKSVSVACCAMLLTLILD
jgi:hypothetical protein